MNTSNLPNERIAATIVASMINEKVLSSIRLKTGDQYFVFAVTTSRTEYVLRMTDKENKKHFSSAIYWQEKFIPLGVPLAKFIQIDMDGKFSPFPSLLMDRLPGNDLINVYSELTSSDKKNLAKEITQIQALVTALPAGLSFGIADSYETITEFKSWYDFLLQRLNLFQGIIEKNGIFDASDVTTAITIANDLKEDLSSIAATPFLWDASERNVIVHHGKISGIVDVDDICFGDPLFVVALTYAGLEIEGYDTEYPDYWTEALQLDKQGQVRLNFYRLFYAIVFMRKHSMITANNEKVSFDVPRLKNMFQQCLERLNS